MKNTLPFTFHTNILVRLLTANMKNFLNPQIRKCVQPLIPVQTDATLLEVTCCVRLHTLLHVVGCCCAKFETGQTFQPTTPNISFVPWSPKRSATMLDPFAQLFQHCWGRARSLRMVYKDLWVVSFPQCIAGPNIVKSCCIPLLRQQCWELLRPFARSLSKFNIGSKDRIVIKDLISNKRKY